MDWIGVKTAYSRYPLASVVCNVCDFDNIVIRAALMGVVKEYLSVVVVVVVEYDDNVC